MAVGMTANLALSAALVPRFGQLGACWAALATAAILVAVGVARAERIWPVQYPLRRALLAAVLASLACAGVLAVELNENLPVGMRVLSGAAAVAVGAVITARTLRRLHAALSIVPSP